MLGEKSPWSAKSDAPWLTISLPDGRGSKVKMVIWSPWSAWWDFSLIGLLGWPNLSMFVWPESVLVVCLYLPVCLNIKAVQTDIYCGKGAEIWFCHICLMAIEARLCWWCRCRHRHQNGGTATHGTNSHGMNSNLFLRFARRHHRDFSNSFYQPSALSFHQHVVFLHKLFSTGNFFNWP